MWTLLDERFKRYRRAPDLRRRTFVNPWDFIHRDRHPNDVYGHGTHVAGTIAQTTGNGLATAGIAYNAKIMPLQVLDSLGYGDSFAIARAIRYAVRHHADVINLSLEFPREVRAAYGFPWDAARKRRLRRLFQAAAVTGGAVPRSIRELGMRYVVQRPAA